MELYLKVCVVVFVLSAIGSSTIAQQIEKEVYEIPPSWVKATDALLCIVLAGWGVWVMMGA